MTDVYQFKEIIVGFGITINEYPDDLGWCKRFFQIEKRLNERIDEMKMEKVKIESILRFATFNEAIKSSGHQKFKIECLHVRDILLDMIEDLEDEMKYAANAEFGFDREIICDVSLITEGLDILNRSISVKILDGEINPMNCNFVDEFSDEINSILSQ